MDRLEWEVEFKLSNSEHELYSMQVLMENKALSGGDLDLCNICFTTDINVLTFGCVAQSISQGTWCSEKLRKNCPTEPCYFNKLTNFYTSFVLNIAAMAAWPLERANSA